MSKPIVYIHDKIYFPSRQLDTELVESTYTRNLYDDASCRRCEYRADRHSYICDTCEAFSGIVKLFNRREIKGVMHHGLPIGDKRNFPKVTGYEFSEVEIRDKRVLAPFTYPVKFTVPLYEYQKPVVEQFLKHKYGLLEAPPRTGKSVMLLSIAISLGQRVAIIADQHDFLKQFEYHIEGHAASGTPQCTNLPELQEKYGKKLYGFPKTEEDFRNFQIFLMPYQQFLDTSAGNKRFNLLKKQIGTLALDEVHRSAATEYSKIVAKFPSRYKMGVSATIGRKDGKQFIVKAILGPVVSRTVQEALTPVVQVHETEFVPRAKYNSGKSSWVYALQALARDKRRNALIVSWVEEDLKAGHSIVIPITFRKHALELQSLINDKVGRKVCEIFLGGGKKEHRDAILDEVKTGKTKVIVGMRRLVQLGLNVPRWSAIYEVMPISNEPNLKQETSRIRTPMQGKATPIIRLFVDKSLGQSLGCARNCIRHMKGFKYEFSSLPSQQEIVKSIVISGRHNESDLDEVDEQFKPVKTKFQPAPSRIKRF